MVLTRRTATSFYLAFLLAACSRASVTTAFQKAPLSLPLAKLPRVTPLAAPAAPQPPPNQRHDLLQRHNGIGRDNDWDGDDIRWTQRMRRRFYRSNYNFGFSSDNPGRQALIGINLWMFVYQTVNTIQLIVRRNPWYWPRDAFSIITDTLLGATNIRGPLTTDFVHINYLSYRQPHRFLTAGFLHGDILHLLLNLQALRRLPSWVESGLGTSLFVTTFLASIVAGNIGHSIVTASSTVRTYCLGASGGICGLYGLMYVALTKMGQSQGASRILQSMLLLFLSGLFWESVSNAGHVGGFLGGIVMGILCVPNYQKDYQMRRKNSLQADNSPREYRQVMGFGIAPSKRGGLVPVQVIWVAAGLLFMSDRRYQSIPANILQCLLRPGSLSI